MNERFSGSWPVYLLTDAGMVFSAQYTPRWGGFETVSFLADSHVTNRSPLGRVFTYDVVFPDPGTDTVSVEAADCFRIIDIPVDN